MLALRSWHRSLLPAVLLVALVGTPLSAATGDQSWSAALRWTPGKGADDDEQRVLCVAKDKDGTRLWAVRSLGQGSLQWQFAGTPPPPPLLLEGLDLRAGQPVQLAFCWSPSGLLWYVDGRLAAQRLRGGLAAKPPAALDIRGPKQEIAWDGEFLPGMLTADAAIRLAGTDSGRALGKIPANRHSIHPPKYPPLASREPGLVLALDFDSWPVPHVDVLGPRNGVRSVPGIEGKGVLCQKGGLRCALRKPLGTSGTIALWANPNWSLPGTKDSHVLVHIATNGPTTDNFHLQTWDGGLSARAGSLGSDTQPGADPKPSQPLAWEAGVWHHLALVWSPTAAQLYVDGKLVGEDRDVSYPYQAKQTIQIGCWAGGSRAADAVLDDVRVYTRPLAATEIARLAQRDAN